MKLYVSARIDNEFWNRFGGNIVMLCCRGTGYGMEMIIDASPEVLEEIRDFSGISVM